MNSVAEDTTRKRPTRGGVLITLVVVLTVVLLGARGLDSARTAALDPENPRANGARAVAQVLQDLGVDVTVARGRGGLDDAHRDAPLDTSTTVVVTSTDELGPSTLNHLDDVARDAHVVHVNPSRVVAEHLDLAESQRTVSTSRTVRADCAGPYADLDLAVTTATALHDVAPDGCFRTQHGPVLAEVTSGVTFFGAGQALENGRITDGDNAAVALRLLGGRDRLVWYVPDLTDLDVDEPTGGALLPPWVGPILWLLLLAGLTLAWWRGRRLGPLASEPIPVVVHAAETTIGRGRLLRRGKDRAHAAAVLRARARQRLAEHLHVPPTDLRTLIIATAERTGRTPDAVAHLLSSDAPAPTHDTALVHLGQELTALTEEVRRP